MLRFLHHRPHATGLATRGFKRFVLGLCLTLPWLNGLTAGPSPNFWPLWGAAVLGLAVLLQWRHVDARLLALAWLVAALLSSVMAVLQYFGWVSGLAPWINSSDVGQAYGNLRQRNQFASLTSIGLLGLLAWQAWRAAPSGLSAWAAAAALLLALGNAASGSRTGFLQWTVIGLVLLAFWFRELIKGRARSQSRQAAVTLSVWALSCYAAFLLVLPRSLQAWRGVDSGSMAERLAGSGQDSRRVLWDNVWHLTTQKPWSGWGWGELDYAHFITAYPGARFSELLDNAHNLPLQLAVELGLPVAVGVVLATAGGVGYAKPWREREPGRLLAWAVLAAIGVHSLLEYPLWYGPFQWTALFCGLWLWRTRGGSASPVVLETVRAGLRSKARAGLLAGLFGSALAVSALDYARVSQLYVPADKRWPSFRMQPLEVLQNTGGTLFFEDDVKFAQLVTSPVTKQNAEDMHTLALDLLHYSPEPRVVEQLIASAILLGHDDAAAFYLARFRAAFSHAMWVQLLARHPTWAVRLPG